MARRKTHFRNVKKYPVFFLLGLVLFLVGMGGILKDAFQGNGFSLSAIVDESVSWYGEMDIEKASLVFSGEENFDNVLQTTLERASVGDIVWNDWVRGKIALAKYEDDFILAFEPPIGRRSRQFLTEFSTENESLITNKIGDRSYFTPAFSSPLGALDYKGYIIVGSSRDVLETKLFSENKLSKSNSFKDLKKDSHKKSLFLLYVDTQKTLPLTVSLGTQYRPLLEALAETIPNTMITLKPDKSVLAMRLNTTLSPGVYSQDIPSERGGKTLPIMARFAPKNVLYFMNGSHLGEKYNHTKDFLSSLHPQFSVLFEGIMKAEVNRLLGEGFDIEEDFFGLLGNQYATLVEGFDVSGGGLSFSLLSQFKSHDLETGLEDFNRAVQRAQSAFSLKKESVELPDGTIREELVALDPDEISIELKTFEGVDYYTADSGNGDGQFSYGIVDEVFVFSSRENGMKSIITSSKQQEDSQSLGANSDFREGVLYHFSPSESYGFINISRLGEYVQVWEALRGNTEENGSWGEVLSFLGESVRSVVFSRKSYPEKSITDVLLFPR